ncbi:hypothetical protein N015_25255 [Pseudomonas asturiensis]|uniref:Uncharacterized protein n=1 Tax=Pseudomonas asturiensis TaxID=1190415 RepID=A0ABX6HJS1_9PSED|nr:hypothetical protein [Pseudomonas asturiensis]QHF05538.1 hypothetical protein N015_25255 [Pseudomonas asturiensis]
MRRVRKRIAGKPPPTRYALIAAELAFLMGLLKPLQHAIEQRSGPVGRNVRKAAV